MTDLRSISQVLVAVGANHRSSALALRDRLFVEDVMVPAFLARLEAAGLREALVLSTCDRVEVQAMSPDPSVAAAIIRDAFATHGEVGPEALDGQFYELSGDDAARHIFRIAASLDSQVIGEPQVLGQLKAAHRMARDAGLVGSGLESVLQAAYSAAKRVRTQTAIGERPVSIAAAAVQLARDVQGDLGKCRTVLIGDGDMGELVATQLSDAGVEVMSVLHENVERAQASSRRLECHAAPWSDMAQQMAEAEIVITSLGRREYTLNADMVRAAITKRRRKLMFLIDLAIPGDVDPAVNRIDEAFLYDLGDLERVAMEGLNRRESEAGQAEVIVDEELQAFMRSHAERGAVPVLNRLRNHVEALREQALKDSGGDAEKATNLLANRLLHEPSVVLREIAAGDATMDIRAAEQLVGLLFRLGQEPDNNNKDGE